MPEIPLATNSGCPLAGDHSVPHPERLVADDLGARDGIRQLRCEHQPCARRNLPKCGTVKATVPRSDE